MISFNPFKACRTIIAAPPPLSLQVDTLPHIFQTPFSSRIPVALQPGVEDKTGTGGIIILQMLAESECIPFNVVFWNLTSIKEQVAVTLV